jgi:hemerythrin-like domain-containing protein
MNDAKPLKRSPELQPLSREHHDGLLFAWKIRRGLHNNTSIDQLRSYVGWYWKNHIRPHFYQEEKILFPCMPEHEFMARMKKEHDLIRELVIAIDLDTERIDFIRLADLIEKHIRFEERELFPSLQTTLSPKELTAIEEQLEKHPVTCGEWKDEFWMNGN